jgi:hypothetical protein
MIVKGAKKDMVYIYIYIYIHVQTTDWEVHKHVSQKFGNTTIYIEECEV